ncbi:hypothetical protein JCM11251_001545 [Rhodosporidiobolus azoricus]
MSTLPSDPVPATRLPGATSIQQDDEPHPIQTTSNTLPQDIKLDVQQEATFRPPQEHSLEEREKMEKEAQEQGSLEKITSGLGGMVLTAPLAILEKVSPSLAHNVQDAATTIAHKVQDYTGQAKKEIPSASSASHSSEPVIRPGGEVTQDKVGAAMEKTVATGGNIASSIKDSATSTAEAVKQNVPSSTSSTVSQPELAHADSSIARNRDAREEAARVTHSVEGVPPSSPSVSSTTEATQSVQTRLVDTASHALDAVKSYLPVSLGGQSSVATSIPAFTVVSSEDVPTSIEAEGTRKQVVPPEERQSAFEYPEQATAKETGTASMGGSSAPPVSEGMAGYAHVAAEKVREIGNKAAEYLPSAEQQQQTAGQATSTLSHAASTASQQASATAAVVGEKVSQATETVKARLPAAEDVKTSIPSVEDVKSKLPSTGGATLASEEKSSSSGNKDWPPPPGVPYSTLNAAPVSLGTSYNPVPAVSSTLATAKEATTSAVATAATTAASTYEAVKHKVGDVVGAASSTASSTSTAAQQTLQSARENATSAMAATHASASDRESKIEAAVKEHAPYNLSALRGDSAYDAKEGGGTATILRDDHRDTVGRGLGGEELKREKEVEEKGEEAVKKALSHEDPANTSSTSASTFGGDGNPAGSDRVSGDAQKQSDVLGGTARFLPGQEKDAFPIEPATTNLASTLGVTSSTGGFSNLAGENLSGSDRMGGEGVGHTGGASFAPHSSGVKEELDYTKPLPPDTSFTGAGSPSTYSSTHAHSAPSASFAAPPAPAHDQNRRDPPQTHSSSPEYKVPSHSVPLEASTSRPTQAAETRQPAYPTHPPAPEQAEGTEVTVSYAKGEEDIAKMEQEQGKKLSEKIKEKLHLSRH